MKNKMLALLILSGALLLINHPVKAGVNLKNGNFYISYTDIKIPGPFAMEITRTYNSKSTEESLFGMGWGSVYFSKMRINGDGSLMIREHGSGGKTLFEPKVADPMRIDKSINQIARAAMKNGDLKNPRDIMELKSKLKSNGDLRHSYWKKYAGLGLLKTPDHDNGFLWSSKERGNQEIIKTDSGYLRTSSDGTKELFNKKGQLVQYAQSKGIFYLDYNKEETLSTVKDNLGRVIKFITNEDGYIEEAIGTDTEGETYKAVYKFNDRNQMVYTKDQAGNHYQFRYDNSSNLTAVVYNPVRTKATKEDGMYMEYYPGTYYIKKITDRDGGEIWYEYISYFDENGDKDDDKYGTRVKKLGYYGDTVTNTYEYEIRTKETGERYTYKIKTNVQGIKTETIYNECCGLPVLISRNGDSTIFKYNNRGLVTEKIKEYEIIRMKYHPVLDKMVEVNYYDPGAEEPVKYYKFQYDDAGNLTRAEDPNQWVKLHYNDEGKIFEMESPGETLSFKYNDLGKPVKIEIADVGSISVTYDKWGEIERVKSDDGHQMALKVTQAFQKLLALVKPAGVDLNM